MKFRKLKVLLVVVGTIQIHFFCGAWHAGPSLSVSSFRQHNMAVSATTRVPQMTLLRAFNDTDTDVFKSYARRLQQIARQTPLQAQQLRPAADSLIAYLLSETTRATTTTSNTTYLSHCLLSAIPAAASINDYRLIVTLTQAAVQYCTIHEVPPLPAHVTATAIASLTKTNVNINKIIKLYRTLPPTFIRPVNAMIQAYLQHDKLQSALDLYRGETDVDSYSLALILQGLLSRKASQPWDTAWELVMQQQNSTTHINNPVVCQLLNMCQETKHFDQVIGLMQHVQLHPDEQTCVQLFQSLPKQQNRTAVLALWQGLQIGTWKGLPMPSMNAYMYAAAMTALGKKDALEQFHQHPPPPSCIKSVWIYNALLQSLVHKKPRNVVHNAKYARQQQHRLQVALDLWNEMQDEVIKRGNRMAAPDTVTYNTLFSILASVAPHAGKGGPQLTLPVALAGREGELVIRLLDHMIESNLSRGETTYRHALQAAKQLGWAEFGSVLDRALQDAACWQRDATKVMNSALEDCLVFRNLLSFAHVANAMAEVGAVGSVLTTLLLIRACGASQQTWMVPTVLSSLAGDEPSAQFLLQQTSIGLDFYDRQGLGSEHVVEALRVCVDASDFDSCGIILKQLREHKVTLVPLLYQQVARMYNRAASSTLQERLRLVSFEPDAGSTALLAEKASTIVQSLDNVSFPLLYEVTDVCGANGLWDAALCHLQELHRRILNPEQTLASSTKRDLRVAMRLQRSLLRHCADMGNVTAALAFCDSIHRFSKSLKSTDKFRESGQVIPEMMGVPEWQLLMTAAAKSGHWRVCLSALQFVQSKVEATHPSLGPSQSFSFNNYKFLCPLLDSAVKCLAIRSQYAWIIRVMGDWISWSGRRPPMPAFLSAVRALALRGRGDEVASLLETCLAPDVSDEARDGADYELAVFAGAITALYNEGLYDEADDVFVSAITRGSMSFVLDRTVVESKECTVVDLHGMNLAVARCMVRVALQRRASGNFASMDDSIDILIVTGRGRNSLLRMRPALRPEMQRMLVEEFFPPLSSFSVPGNTGALLISSDDVKVWLEYQRQVKGSTMLAVAVALRRLSTKLVTATGAIVSEKT